MRLVIGALLLLSVFFIVTEIWSRHVAYEVQFDQTVTAGRNITEAAVEHTEQTLDTVSWVLDGIVERVETDGVDDAAKSRLRRFLVSRVQKKDSPLQGLFVYDHRGAWIVSTTDRIPEQANNADREYFDYHRSHTDRAVHVGLPVISRTSGQWVIPVSRRLNDKAGDFAGVALATIPVRHFERYYERLSIGRHGSLLLAMKDGVVITRRPTAASVTASSVRETPLFRYIRESNSDNGSVLLTTRFDGIERLHSYRISEKYPLMFVVGFAHQDVFADWTRVTWEECAAVAMLILSVNILAFWLLAQVRARIALEEELRLAYADLQARNAELNRLALTDGLTGLHNRRHFDERHQAETARAVREGTALSLILIDVDYFKRYNDVHGHAAGDACLRIVAQALSACVSRPADIVARYGGEEFVALLPDTNLDGARYIAEKMRRAVREQHMEHRGSELQWVTISAGAASSLSLRGDKTLVEAADAALYAAKAAGRDQVSIGQIAHL